MIIKTRLNSYLKVTLLLLAILCLSSNAAPQVFQVDGIYYSINEEDSTTVSVATSGEIYNEETNGYIQVHHDVNGSISIPSTVRYNGFTYTVTGIGDYAFLGYENLTDIQIPNSVSSIGLDAFRGTQLFDNQVGIVYAGQWAIGFNGEIPEEEHMTFRPGTIGISDESFSFLNMISLEIPKSVLYIGRYAFRTDLGEKMPLTSIVIGESVKTIGREAFFTGSSDHNWGTNLKEITCLAKIPPKNESYLFQPYDSYVHDYYETQLGGAFSGEVQESRITYNGELEYFLYLLSDAIYKEATLYVPRGSIEAYKSAEDWCRFINIVAVTDHFDVNGDDEVTIADVNSVIEVIQHGSNDQFNTSNCDVNDDGEVTIADINAIINAIIGI